MKISKQTLSSSPVPSPEEGFGRSEIGRRLRDLLDEGNASQRSIAEFLLRNPVRAAAWGIEELSSNAGTSTATLTRFAKAMGFAGFASLRAAVAEAVQSTFQPVFRPVEKLRGAVQRGSSAGRTGGPNPVVAESIEASLLNLQSAAAGIDLGQLAELATALSQARSVYTLGFGISAHLAALLALDLQPFCPQLINVVEFGGTEVAAGRLMNIQPGDVLIAISFPRYAADALRLARYSRDRGARVVAITDSMASPLVAIAQDTLLAPAVHPVMSSSSAAALLLIEALVTSLMVSRHGHVEQAQKLTDAISDYLVNESRLPKR